MRSPLDIASESDAMVRVVRANYSPSWVAVGLDDGGQQSKMSVLAEPNWLAGT